MTPLRQSLAVARGRTVCYQRDVMRTFLDFEKPIAELEGKIAELRHLSSTGEINIAEEIGRLQVKLDGCAEADSTASSALGRRSRSRVTSTARTARDYIAGLVDDFVRSPATRRSPRIRR